MLRARLTFCVLLPLTAMLAGCPVFPEQTPADPQQLREQTTGAEAWIYVPSYHTSDRAWPLVITLHGSAVWDGAYRQALEWKHLAEEHGFLVAAPELRSAEGVLPQFGRFDRLREDERKILAVRREMVRLYNADPDVVLLTGFSAGGYPMYWTGLRNPGEFDMLVARACNSSADLLENADAPPAARELPIRIFWGKDDLKPLQDQSWQAFRYLREHGCERTELKKVAGGHLRRPQTAWHLWQHHMPKRYRKRH